MLGLKNKNNEELRHNLHKGSLEVSEYLCVSCVSVCVCEAAARQQSKVRFWPVSR